MLIWLCLVLVLLCCGGGYENAHAGQQDHHPCPMLFLHFLSSEIKVRAHSPKAIYADTS
jgi:hypothetical protein